MSLLVSVGLARLTEAISAENVAAIAKLHSGPGGRQYRIEPQIGRPDVYAAEIPDEHRDHEPEVAKEPLLLPVSRESGQTHRQFAGGGGGSERERREQQLQQARASAAEWGQLQQRIKQEEDSKMASPLARAWQSPGRQPADAASPQPMRQLQHNQQSPACDESKMLSPVQDRKNTPSPASTPPPSPLSPSPLSLSDDVDAEDMRAESGYSGQAWLSVGRLSSARKAFVVNQFSFKILYAPSLSPFSFSSLACASAKSPAQAIHLG